MATPIKECGTCALCCKLVDVPDLSSRGEWCRFARPGDPCGGCSVHDTRPATCRGYECLWKLTSVLDKNLRPDRCGVIFEAHHNEMIVVANVDEKRPDAWKVGASKLLIQQMLTDRYVVWVMYNDDRHLLLPEGMTEETAWERTEVIWNELGIQG